MSEFIDSPFLSSARAFELPVSPEFLMAGDFDADGHWDVLATASGSERLYLLAGNGRGGFGLATSRQLLGRVTALVSGEINRRDGLADLAVGIVGPAGPQLLVLEGPEGAFKAEPETFALPAEVTALALDQLDDEYEMDVAVAAGSKLLILHGRDRRLSLDPVRQAEVRPAVVDQRSFPFAITSMTVGDFRGDSRKEMALLAADGTVHVASVESLASIAHGEFVAVDETNARGGALLRARVSGRPNDDLVVVDQDSHQLHFLFFQSRESGVLSLESRPARTDSRRQSTDSGLVSLDVEGEPVAVLPLRLNEDALSDLVILKKGAGAVTEVITAPVATVSVNSTTDVPDGDTSSIANLIASPGSDGVISLREAIIAANNTAGTDTIAFNIPGAGPHTITPGTGGLPTITDPVTIDGYTQPGSSPNTLANGNDAVLKIELDGSSAGAAGRGLFITAGSSTVRGLVINRFRFNGIRLEMNGSNVIEGNFIGTNVSGTASLANIGGVSMTELSNNNTVGGTTPGARNLISGNTGEGVVAFEANPIFGQPPRGSSGNVVQGNYIGTNAAGTAALTNGNVGGVGIGSRCFDNIIGGTTPEKRNLIAGSGVRVAGDVTLVQGNYIGTDLTGTLALGSQLASGIFLSGKNSTIGGTTPAARNIISGNRANGIEISDSNATGNLVQGNYIGTDVNGTAALGNGGGSATIGFTGVLFISNPSNNTLGGTTAGARNIISGTLFGHGISFNGGTGNFVQGNYIGTDVTGTVALANARGGVFIRGDQVGNQALNNVIGGTTAGAGNVISGNAGNGFRIFGAFTRDNRLEGNLIGTQADGTSPLGNASHGVLITSTCSFCIPVPPASAPFKNTIGGTISGAANTIAFNGGDGVFADSGTRNAIQSNSIFSNTGLGIDLGTDGVLPNDPNPAGCPADEDTGANNLQNYPVLTGAGSAGGNTTITGTLNSTAGTTFNIDFYSNTAPDPTSHGEGQTLLGSTSVTTDGSCNASFDVTFPTAVPVGQVITATATDANGNTSEFSQARQVFASPTAAPATISGRILANDGTPIPGAIVNLSGTQTRKTISDASGNYRFDNVETSGFYTVTPLRANYSFGPASRSFSQLGNTTEAAFTGTPDALIVGNAIDTPEYFVRQHYLDFLGREPDEAGFNFWSDQMLECGADAGCLERRRINVSAAYFLSIEFQHTGGLVDGLYKASYGVRPQFGEFMPDAGTIAQNVVVGRSGWEQQLHLNKQAFVDAFVQRAEFRSAFDSMSNEIYIATLIAHTGVAFTESERDALVSDLAGSILTRAAVLLRIAADDRFVTAKRNEAFVMMQYFGYLRRDPDDSGYQFWLNKLNQFGGNFEQAEMVKAFIVSGEYRDRFPR